MNLIDLLVKKTNEEGWGWPGESALCYQTNQEDGSITKFLDRNLVMVADYYWGNCDDASVFNWLTKSQYESALAASEGWIQWAGGERPVDSDAIVEVRFRNPSRNKFNGDRAWDFTWSRDGFGGEIIAYRLQQQTKSEQACDDAAQADDEADLNECIGQDVDVPEWNGEGLPPAGCECEARYRNADNAEWAFFRCVGVDCGVAFGWSGKEAVTLGVDSYEFRPLRNEAGKLRDEAGLALYHAINWNAEGEMVSPSRMEDYKKAYDAIAAGKIPGVKLEEK